MTSARWTGLLVEDEHLALAGRSLAVTALLVCLCALQVHLYTLDLVRVQQARNERVRSLQSAFRAPNRSAPAHGRTCASSFDS